MCLRAHVCIHIDVYNNFHAVNNDLICNPIFAYNNNSAYVFICGGDGFVGMGSVLKFSICIFCKRSIFLIRLVIICLFTQPTLNKTKKQDKKR